MQNFGNHMETGTSHRSNIAYMLRMQNQAHLAQNYNFQEWTRHKQLRGSHKVLTIFLIFFACKPRK